MFSRRKFLAALGFAPVAVPAAAAAMPQTYGHGGCRLTGTRHADGSTSYDIVIDGDLIVGEASERVTLRTVVEEPQCQISPYQIRPGSSSSSHC